MLTYVHCKLKQKHCTQELKMEQNTQVIAPLNRKIVVNCSSLRKPLILNMQKKYFKTSEYVNLFLLRTFADA